MAEPVDQLKSALLASAARAGCPIEIATAGWQKWTAPRFTGAALELAICAERGPALDAWLASMSELELPAESGHLLADVDLHTPPGKGDPAVILYALIVEAHHA